MTGKVYFSEKKIIYQWRASNIFCPLCGKQNVFEFYEPEAVIRKCACVDCKKHFDVWVGGKNADDNEPSFNFDI